ncbi:hypothetical protein D5086_023822 [Populus alba]|uniref:Uncharacterized protein n=1 Tax=Populus alba TaxID=43335 RepID=A0ACC4BBS6_POPAL
MLGGGSTRCTSLCLLLFLLPFQLENLLLQAALRMLVMILSESIVEEATGSWTWMICIGRIQKTIDRYRKNAKQLHTVRIDVEQYSKEQLRQESANMAKKIEIIEILQRKLLGQDLDSCSPEELHDIGNQLEISLSNIRARKTQLFKEQIEQLQAKERLLLMENARLTKQRDAQPLQQSTQSNQVVSYLSSCSKSSDIVETDLYIGQPQMRWL